MKSLTKQETIVAHNIAQGLVEKEIAEKLFISKHTVHTHYRNIRTKWGAKNIADITRMYILSLPKPSDILKVMYTVCFLMIQLNMVVSGNDFEARRVRSRQSVRVVKVGSKTKN